MSEIVTGLSAAFNFINAAKPAKVVELSSVHEETGTVIARFRVLDIVEWESLLLYLLRGKDSQIRGTLCIGTDYILKDGKLFYAWTFTLMNQLDLDGAVKDFVNLVTSYVTNDTAAPQIQATALEPAAVDAKVSAAVTAVKTLLRNNTHAVPSNSAQPTVANTAPKSKISPVSSEQLIARLGAETPSNGLAVPVDVGTRGVFKMSERLTASRNPTMPVVKHD